RDAARGSGRSARRDRLARPGARTRNATRKVTSRTEVSEIHCTATFLLSAPAVKPWTVAIANIGKLVRCTACQTRRGSLRIDHDVTWIATSRYVAAMPHATGPGR